MSGTNGAYSPVSLQKLYRSGLFVDSDNAGAGTYNLDVVGTTVLDTACVTVTNPSDRTMRGWVYAEINAPRIRRVGSGDATLTMELSFDGGTSWINLSIMHLTRVADPALETVETDSLDRVAGSLSIPPNDSLTVCVRTTIDVATAYGAISNMTVGNGLRVMTGAEIVP